MTTHNAGTPFDASAITRPDRSLMTYYFIVSVLTGPLFPIFIVHYWCRYITLRFRFDDEGVSMSYGVLFRREVLLTYRRIQDIHLKRGIIQRWLGLSTLSLQTASGSSGAEMAIEGVLEAERLRDFLYERMRGVREDDDAPGGAAPDDEALHLLTEIRDAMAALRPALERLSAGGGS